MKLFVGIANVLMTIAYLLSVAVQYNDPDPLKWIAIYSLAAVLCMAFALGRMTWWHAIVTAAVALLWALSLLPSFWGLVSLVEVFESIGMKTEPVEHAREFGGLLTVVAWMFFLGIYERSVTGIESARLDQ